VIWYEWHDEIWTVWGYYFFNLVFALKFLNVFMGREESIEFDILRIYVSFVSI